MLSYLKIEFNLALRHGIPSSFSTSEPERNRIPTELWPAETRNSDGTVANTFQFRLPWNNFWPENRNPINVSIIQIVNTDKKKLEDEGCNNGHYVQSSVSPGGGLVPYGEGDSTSDTEDESSAPSSLNLQEKPPMYSSVVDPDP